MSMLTAGMQTLGLSAAARKFPKCDYPEGSDTRRLVALQIVCGGAFTFSGKRLIKEGPLCKRNRDGLRTYQFILLSTELLYCEASSQAEKYEVHHVYPLAQLRISNETQGKVGHEEDAFTILTPVKSFVVEAVDGAEKAEWYSTLEVGAEGLSTVLQATGLECCGGGVGYVVGPKARTISHQSTPRTLRTKSHLLASSRACQWRATV
mmetsp:Transcript_11374/g.30617  ORF Transcript_11374/g.30617 Transcript_11374/m.30617 type:complete len:207 (-) Transcript_11374:1085-1705(-)